MHTTLLGLALLGAGAQASSPTIELSSLYDAIIVQPDAAASGQGGRLRIGGPGIQAAFLPGPDRWNPADPSRSEGHRMWIELSLQGQLLAKFGLHVQKIEGVYSRASVKGLSAQMEEEGFVTEYVFAKAGTYGLRVLVDEQELAALNFDVEIVAAEDPLDPKTTTLVHGPWDSWAYLAVRPDKEDSSVEFRTWLRGGGPRGQVDYTVEVYRGQEHVACGGKLRVGERRTESQTFRLGWAVRQPGAFGLDDLTSVDGLYRIEVEADGEPYGRHEFVVRNGRLQPHERSAVENIGARDYLLPRLWAQRASARRGTTWMERQDPLH